MPTWLFSCYLRHKMQICSGVTRGKVLHGELYAQRLQKLIYLHLSTDCFFTRWDFMKESVDKCREINFCNICAIFDILFLPEDLSAILVIDFIADSKRYTYLPIQGAQ